MVKCRSTGLYILAGASTDDPLLKENAMNIKEITIKQLLTTTDSYNAIVETIKEAHPAAQSTVKCVAFYAHQLRKVDKTCLAHRETTRSKESNLAALIAKYATCVEAEAEDAAIELDEALVEVEADADISTEVAEIEVVEVIEVPEVVKVPKTRRSRKAA